MYTWVCAYCGMEFETDHYGKRYCSPAHKQRAYELRKAAKQPQEAEIL